MSWRICTCIKDENGDPTKEADPECPECDGRGIVLEPDPADMVKDILLLSGLA